MTYIMLESISNFLVLMFLGHSGFAARGTEQRTKLLLI